MQLTFSGRRALILGGSCDLGICLAKVMIREDLFPILTFRSEAGLRRIEKEMEPFYGRCETVRFDLADARSMDLLFAHLKEDLDFLVDFAQGDLEGLIASVEEDEFRSYFMQNISNRAEMLKRAGRVFLRKRDGRLIFISSAAAARTHSGQGFYAAAKLASEALYRNLGLELAGRGITALTLRPGYIDAGRGQRYLKNRGKEALRKVPIKRALTEKEVAQSIVFFLSDSARAFNATEIIMDGGLTAGK
jgi:3-oxoacyl-[acyl-carrier protein] reductase